MPTETVFAAIGGVLIGISALLLFFSLGKIAGISGIFWQISGNIRSSKDWQWLFVIGMLVGASLIQWLSNHDTIPAPQNNSLLAIIAGLLVGFGTRLGNGCTSGHGVCGIGRLSMRSIVATITFMAVAVLTVLLMKVVL